MTEYVLSFIFDKYRNIVALIKKERPDFQKGRFNGIGGKIEKGETPLEAAVRELKEEANLDILVSELNYVFSIIHEKKDYKVYVFTAYINDMRNRVKTMTDEEISVFHVRAVRNLPDDQKLPNLGWVVDMCRNADKITYKITNNESILCT